MKNTVLKKDFLICFLLLVLFIVLPFVYPSRYFIGQLTIFFIWTTVISQWNIVFGYAGIFSLAQTAIFAVGGYATGMLALYLDLSIWLTLPLGGVVAVIFSVVIGLACLRLSGPYVALLTLAVSQVVYLLIITDTYCFFYEGVTCRNFTGGTRGLANYGDFGFRQILPYKYQAFGNYFLAMSIMFLSLLFTLFVIRGPLGFAFKAIRDNPVCAVSRGLNRVKFQLIIFSVSAFFTGLAGGVYAGHFQVMGANTLYMSLLLYLLSMMVIGGLGTPWGPALGTATLMIADEFLKELVEWRLAGLGIILMAFILFYPKGISGFIESFSIKGKTKKL